MAQLVSLGLRSDHALPKSLLFVWPPKFISQVNPWVGLIGPASGGCARQEQPSWQVRQRLMPAPWATGCVISGQGTGTQWTRPAAVNLHKLWDE